MDLIESMTASDIAILRDQAHIPTKKNLLELTSQDALLAQKKLLSKQLEALTETLSKLPTQLHSAQTSHSSILQVAGCTICGEANESGCCILNEEQIAHEVNYMGNQPRGNFKTTSSINSRDSGRITLVTNSTETRVVHLQAHNSRCQVSMTEPRSWKRLWLNSCKCQCLTKRAQSLQLRI